MCDCEDDPIVCPRGDYDCTAFCDICEGNSEYCPTCEPYAHEQATNYLRMYND